MRFELLTAAQITQMEQLFEQVGPDFKRAARGYRLLVLDRRYDQAAVHRLHARAGTPDPL